MWTVGRIHFQSDIWGPPLPVGFQMGLCTTSSIPKLVTPAVCKASNGESEHNGFSFGGVQSLNQALSRKKRWAKFLVEGKKNHFHSTIWVNAGRWGLYSGSLHIYREQPFRDGHISEFICKRSMYKLERCLSGLGAPFASMKTWIWIIRTYVKPGPAIVYALTI